LYTPIKQARLRDKFRILARYPEFLRQWRQFRALGGDAQFSNLAPVVFDRDPSTQTGGMMHYFQQDCWALRKLAELRPAEHHDVGSRIDGFTAQATVICPIIYWDIRPPAFDLPRFTFRKGDVTKLPLPDQSVSSLSCLHTAEHVGLGRYGDTIDPAGTEKTIRELIRVVKPGGTLIFSMPVGREHLDFNNQRIWPPGRPVEIAAELKLTEFSAVTTENKLVEKIAPEQMADEKYACGLYLFTRPA
jgi:SAM-dependent methyltransferase